MLCFHSVPSLFHITDCFLTPTKLENAEIMMRLSICDWLGPQQLLRNEAQVSLQLIKERITTEI